MADTELAWAAGFFDGEGWSSTNRGSFTLGVSQKDRRPVDRFAAAVGGDITVYENRLYDIRLSGEKALAVLHRLWPYLSEPKREQARRALEKAHARRSRRYAALNELYDAAMGWSQ